MAKIVTVICEDNLTTVNTPIQNELHFTKALPHGAGKIMATEIYTDSECASLVLEENCIQLILHQKLRPCKQTNRHRYSKTLWYKASTTRSLMNLFVQNVHSVKIRA